VLRDLADAGDTAGVCWLSTRQLSGRKGGVCMARYGKGAQKSVKRAMHKRKKGTLTSGKSRKRVKNRKQAIAIGLSEARRKGAKVPRKKAA
jgi:Family of unknown function (DUF6496)